MGEIDQGPIRMWKIRPYRIGRIPLWTPSRKFKPDELPLSSHRGEAWGLDGGEWQGHKMAETTPERMG